MLFEGHWLQTLSIRIHCAEELVLQSLRDRVTVLNRSLSLVLDFLALDLFHHQLVYQDGLVLLLESLATDEVQGVVV